MELAPNLEGILSSSLKWIFVGGKGGVGKTTTAASLAILLASQKESVLIISTDPAHNLSDAFDQKLGDSPTAITGVPNLYGMEVRPKVAEGAFDVLGMLGLEPDESTRSLMQETVTSIPGIDEAMSFSELLKEIRVMQFSVVVFDTAPTGHTMRLLNFPSLLDRALEKLLSIKQSLGGFITQLGGLMGKGEVLGQLMSKAFEKVEEMKILLEEVNRQFQDPNYTTFIGVCIPEFLSVYETERMVQELFKFSIEIGHIVVNQVLFPADDCRMCTARSKMQKKYLDQIYEIYSDFHVVVTPLLEEEVRGLEKLRSFGSLLVAPSPK